MSRETIKRKRLALARTLLLVLLLMAAIAVAIFTWPVVPPAVGQSNIISRSSPLWAELTSAFVQRQGIAFSFNACTNGEAMVDGLTGCIAYCESNAWVKAGCPVRNGKPGNIVMFDTDGTGGSDSSIAWNGTIMTLPGDMMIEGVLSLEADSTVMSIAFDYDGTNARPFVDHNKDKGKGLGETYLDLPGDMVKATYDVGLDGTVDSCAYATSAGSAGTAGSAASALTAGSAEMLYKVGDFVYIQTDDGNGDPVTRLACSQGVATASCQIQNATLTSGSGGTITAAGVSCTDCVALGSETTGNYAGSSSEGGAATSATTLAPDLTYDGTSRYQTAKGIKFGAGPFTGCGADTTLCFTDDGSFVVSTYDTYYYSTGRMEFDKGGALKGMFVVQWQDPASVYTASLSGTSLTGNRLFGFPNASGTLLVDGSAPTLTGRWRFGKGAQFDSDGTNGPIHITPAIAPSAPPTGALYNESATNALVNYQGIAERLSGCIYTLTASDTDATTAETSIVDAGGSGTRTLPASFLVAGKTIRITAYGVFSTAAGAPPDLTLKFYYGSTAVADSGATGITAGVTNGQWEADIVCTTRTTGAVGTHFCQGDAHFHTTHDGELDMDLENTATVTVSTTGTLALDLKATWSASGQSITTTNAVIEVLN